METLRQEGSPLYPDIFWNQPINKRAAGTLLILGGHGRKFSQTQSSYQYALRFGIGQAQVLLPDAVRKLTGPVPDCHFLASTPSGSFARESSSEAIAMANDMDGVLISGELSSNAETIGFLETFIEGVDVPIIITGESLESLLASPQIFNAVKAVIATPLQLSHWAKAFKIPIYVKSPNYRKEVELITALRALTAPLLISQGRDYILSSYSDTISVTPAQEVKTEILAAAVATFLIQHTDSFKAATSGVWQAQQTN